MYDILIACIIAVVVTAIISTTITTLYLTGKYNKKLSGNLIVSESEGIYLEVDNDSFIKNKDCHFILLEILRTR